MGETPAVRPNQGRLQHIVMLHAHRGLCCAGWYNGKYNPGPPTAASKAPAVKGPLVCKYGPKSKLGQNKVCN